MRNDIILEYPVMKNIETRTFPKTFSQNIQKSKKIQKFTNQNILQHQFYTNYIDEKINNKPNKYITKLQRQQNILNKFCQYNINKLQKKG